MDSQQGARFCRQRAGTSILRLLLTTGISATLFLLLILGLSAPASQAASVFWYVSPQGDDGNSCNISTSPCYSVQAALNKAGVGDTIRVAQGIYTDSNGTVAQVTRDITLQGGWNTLFTVHDSVAYPTILNAQGHGPVITIVGSGPTPISPLIEGFILTNGNGTGVAGCTALGAGGCGGGIFGTNATPHILENAIINNVATARGEGFGGGIYLQGYLSGGAIEGNVIVSNVASISSTAFISGWGGGICLYNIDAVVYDNLIQDNIASTTKGWGFGGGILLRHSVGQVISNVVVNNIASTVATGELSGWGGGISVFQSRGSEVSIIDNELRDNTASLAGHGWGGGIHIASSNVSISGNQIVANVGGASEGGGYYEHRGDGGGIYARYGTWTIHSNHILSNTSATTGTGFGGGCQLEYGDVLFEHNLVAGNAATRGIKDGWGGGVNLLYCDGSVVRHNTIRDNVGALGGTGYGGGLSVRDGSLTVEGNSILDNRATVYGNFHSWGGGVRVDSAAPVTFTNNVIAHNQARTKGGGIHVFGFTATTPAHAVLVHNTLAENARGGTGEGVYVAQYATVSMTNNIVVSHSHGIFCETSSSAATADYTLFYGNEEADTTGTVSNGYVITGAPCFVAPAKDDFHIQASSAALDSGTNTYVNIDMDGDLRPIGDWVDVGADEFRPFEIFLPIVNRGSP